MYLRKLVWGITIRTLHLLIGSAILPLNGPIPHASCTSQRLFTSACNIYGPYWLLITWNLWHVYPQSRLLRPQVNIVTESLMFSFPDGQCGIWALPVMTLMKGICPNLSEAFYPDVFRKQLPRLKCREMWSKSKSKIFFIIVSRYIYSWVWSVTRTFKYTGLLVLHPSAMTGQCPMNFLPKVFCSNSCKIRTHVRFTTNSKESGLVGKDAFTCCMQLAIPMGALMTLINMVCKEKTSLSATWSTTLHSQKKAQGANWVR